MLAKTLWFLIFCCIGRCALSFCFLSFFLLLSSKIIEGQNLVILHQSPSCYDSRTSNVSDKTSGSIRISELMISERTRYHVLL